MGVGYSSLAPDEATAGPARSPCAADGGSQVAVGRSSSTADNAAASRKAAGAASARTAPAEVAASKKGPSPPPPPPRVKRPRAAHLTAAAPDGTGEFAAPAAPSKPAGPTLSVVEGATPAAWTGLAFRRAVSAALDQCGTPVKCAAQGIKCWRVDVELPAQSTWAAATAGGGGSAPRTGHTGGIGGSAGEQTSAGGSRGGGASRAKPSQVRARTVEVHVFKETVLRTGGVHCDHCTYMGWTHHPVSQDAFHFIVAARGSDLARALREGGQDGIQSARVAREALHGDESHLLHGKVHSSGFGHLLRVNGRDGGATSITGTDLMNLWDKLCGALGCRFVSVKDVSTKYYVDWRLLHTAAYGLCWYGRWGYAFGRGSYGVKKKDYSRAAEGLHRISLEVLRADFAPPKGKASAVTYKGDAELMAILDLYAPHFGRAVGGASGGAERGAARNLGQLLTTMIALRRAARSDREGPRIDPMEPPKRTAVKQPKTAAGKRQHGGGGGKGGGAQKVVSAAGSRWSAERMTQAREALIEVLRKASGKRVARQACRDGARCRIGDTGLLDHALKFISGARAGDKVVVRYINPQTKGMEYRLEKEKDAGRAPAAEKQRSAAAAVVVAPAGAGGAGGAGGGGGVESLSKAEILRDIVYVYYSVLAHYAPLEFARQRGAAKSTVRGGAVDTYSRSLLDTKLFVKDYGGGVWPEAAAAGAEQGCAPPPKRARLADGARPQPAAANGSGFTPSAPVRVCVTVQLDADGAEGGAGGDAGPSMSGGGVPGIHGATLRRLPPAETLLLPAGATLGSVKEGLRKIYGELYTLPRHFALPPGAPLSGVRVGAVETAPLASMGVSGTLVLRGAGCASLASDSAAKQQAVVMSGWSSTGAWRVKCQCGARDDDGERMISCEVCEVWVHTRCQGIRETEDPPDKFVCEACVKSGADAGDGKGHRRK